MARRVFYSFQYKPDNFRAAQIRSIGAVEGNKPASDNEWENVTGGGEAAIKRWITEQMEGKSCVVVLVGSNTAGRKWINHEIKKAWTDGKGLLGVHIHNIKDSDSKQSTKGANPFDYVTAEVDDKDTILSSVVNIYDPPKTDSKEVYAYIADNLANWIENAVALRERYWT